MFILVSLVPFYSEHTGTINIKCSSNNVESSSVTVYDWWVNDDCSTDKTSKFGSSVSLRNNGACSVTYSTDCYLISPTVDSSSSLLPITGLNNCTGELQIDFDFYARNGDDNNGIVLFEDSNNYKYFKDDGMKIWRGENVNGSFSEDYSNNLNYQFNTWLHMTTTITSTTFTVSIYNNNTLIRTRNVSVQSDITKIGFESSWVTNGQSKIKNIQIKPL